MHTALRPSVLPVRQASHQDGGSQHIPLCWAVDLVAVLMPCVQTGVLLKQCPLLAQRTSLREMDGCFDCSSPCFMGVALQWNTTAQTLSDLGSVCLQSRDCGWASQSH